MADDGHDRVLDAWRAAQRRLPGDWALQGLRCASAGLSETSRSDEWVAIAVGPRGVERTYQAADPVDALEGLTRALVG